MNTDTYLTDDAAGDRWQLMLGDSCERLTELPDESIHLSVYSPPFQSLYVYSATPRDLGNSADRNTFFDHYRYVIREVHRLTRPGRISCVHTADVATTKATHGVTGLYDFPGDVIRAHEAEGWTYTGRVWVDKDPQAQAIRTKSQALLFATKNRDTSKTRPAIGDQLLIFRKPGDADPPISVGVPTDDDRRRGGDVTNEEWIQWARPVWLGIRETHTLNAAVARDNADERHLHPLQLDFIERCVRLWSNPGETVLTPFAGIGSEVYTAVKLGRRGIGVELKPSYWRTAVDNLQRLENEMAEPTLFDEAG
jgi:DNA modification methylase